MNFISKLIDYKNFQFSIIIFFVFLFSISISNVLNRVYFAEKIDKNFNKIEKYQVFHETYKNLSKQLKTYELKYNCEVSNNLDERHRLRWVGKLFWEKAYKLKVHFLGETNIVFQLHKLIIGSLIFLSYLSIILLFKKEDSKNIIFPITGIFVFFFSIVSVSSVSEINYSVVELLFLSLGFYSIFTKKNLLFLFICILAPLNRESGFILPIIYLILLPKNIKFFLFVSIASVLTYTLLNLQIIKCVIEPGFLYTTDPKYLTFNQHSIFEKFKIIVQDYIFYIIILLLYWKNTILQKKLLLIIFIYAIIFIFAAPFQHSIIRILYLPSIMLFVYSAFRNLEFSVNKKTYIY